MSDSKTYSIYLTYDELMLIDSKCSDKAQEVVDKAKEENQFGLDPFSNEVLAKALKLGKLSWGSKKISCCKCCNDKPKGYFKYTRSSGYHRKGDNNYDRPFSYWGVDPCAGFVRFDGLPGICSDCWRNVYLPKLVKYIIDNDLPIEIAENDIAKTRYKRDSEIECSKCKKKMYESELIKCYPSRKCPCCGYRSSYFKETGEFKMREAEE